MDLNRRWLGFGEVHKVAREKAKFRSIGYSEIYCRIKALSLVELVGYGNGGLVEADSSLSDLEKGTIICEGGGNMMLG